MDVRDIHYAARLEYQEYDLIWIVMRQEALRCIRKLYVDDTMSCVKAECQIKDVPPSDAQLRKIRQQMSTSTNTREIGRLDRYVRRYE